MKLKTMRYDLTPVRVARIKKKEVDAGENEKKKEALFTVGRIVNWYKQYGK